MHLIRIEWIALVGVIGCSTSPDRSAQVQSASGGTAALGSGGTTGATGGSKAGLGGGVSAAGGVKNSGGSLSSGGSVSSAAGGAQSGGAATTTSGGSTSGGDASRSGGAPSGDPGVAAVLQGQRWEVTCPSVGGSYECDNFPPGMTSCPANGYTMLDKMLTFGGTQGMSYDVSLRFRGVVEPKLHSGGTSAGGHLYIGGTPVATNYNVYSMEISAPPQILYFNDDDGLGEGHFVFPIDQMTTVRIDAGASVRLYSGDSNCISLANCDMQGCDTPYIVPGVPPAPAAWQGQFIQMDVVSVAVAN